MRSIPPIIAIVFTTLFAWIVGKNLDAVEDENKGGSVFLSVSLVTWLYISFALVVASFAWLAYAEFPWSWLKCKLAGLGKNTSARNILPNRRQLPSDDIAVDGYSPVNDRLLANWQSMIDSLLTNRPSAKQGNFAWVLKWMTQVERQVGHRIKPEFHNSRLQPISDCIEKMNRPDPKIRECADRMVKHLERLRDVTADELVS